MLRAMTLGVVLCSAAGCVPGGTETALVPNTFFGAAQQPTLQTMKLPDVPTAAQENAVRVAQIGQKLVAGNPGARLQPVFTTVGADWEEVFHRGDREVIITEGLVKQCKNDAQLAGILAHELAKMAAEREALRGTAAAPRIGQGPPPEVRVGTDSGGAFGSPDGTRLVEEAKYARDRRNAPALAPDTRTLARAYLQRADFAPTDLDAAGPLLRLAENNARLEKQMVIGTR